MSESHRFQGTDRYVATDALKLAVAFVTTLPAKAQKATKTATKKRG